MKSNRIIIIFLGLFPFIVFLGCSNTGSSDLTRKNTTVTTVVNLKTDTYDEYIGRRSQPYTHMLTPGTEPHSEGWLGNPHPIGFCRICNESHTRTECITAFEKDFHKAIDRNDDFKKAVLSLKGKRLGCFCKPKDCHGDIIKAYIRSQ